MYFEGWVPPLHSQNYDSEPVPRSETRKHLRSLKWWLRELAGSFSSALGGSVWHSKPAAWEQRGPHHPTAPGWGDKWIHLIPKANSMQPWARAAASSMGGRRTGNFPTSHATIQQAYPRYHLGGDLSLVTCFLEKNVIKLFVVWPIVLGMQNWLLRKRKSNLHKGSGIFWEERTLHSYTISSKI